MKKKYFLLFWAFILILIVSSCGSNKTFLRDPYAWRSIDAGTTIINKGKPYEDTIAVLTHRIDTLSTKLAMVSENDLRYPPTQKYSYKGKLVTPYYPYYTKGKYEADYSKLRLGDPVEKDFYTAYANFRKGNYNISIILFSNFLKKYPYHYLDDDALFMIGETYYLQKEYFLAIDEFQKILNKYKKSNKMKESILRMAVSYRRLNNRKEAKRHYRKVIRMFPNSKEALIARKQIATL